MSGVSKAIVQPLLSWYDAGHRDLPWRSEPAPYRVWVSEIMLQQTRVEAVRGYFSRWMNALPDIPALAAADEAVYTKLWEGLGYYSRVRNLHRAAVLLCEQYGGELPADYDRLLALPGVGEYTAGAVASIAFGLPVPAVDGNVLRVAARLDNDFTPITDAKFKRQTRERFAALMPSDRPGDLNQSLMELGATVVCRTAHRAVTTARFSISARAFTAETRLCCRSEPQKRRGEWKTAPYLLCAAVSLSVCGSDRKRVCSPVCGSCPRSMAIFRRTSCARRSPKWAGACESCSLCGLPNIFSPMWSGT